MPSTTTAAMYNRIYTEIQRHPLPETRTRKHEKQRGPVGRLLHRINFYYAFSVFTVLSWGNHVGLWKWEARRK